MNGRLSLIVLALTLCGAGLLVPALTSSESQFVVCDDPAKITEGAAVVSESARYEKLYLGKRSDSGAIDSSFSGQVELRGVIDTATGEQLSAVVLSEGVAELAAVTLASDFALREGGASEWQSPQGRRLPGWWALVPPLVAIVFAIAIKEVLLSLLMGVWVGVIALEGGLFEGTKHLVDRHLVEALGDAGHVKILIFSCLLGAMVALISRMGGVKAIVEALAKRSDSRKGAQLITWLMGIVIFFDDYANALLVGNTMRPVTDRYRISREKLAYIVDATAAPVACIAPISTWIAAEVGYIHNWLEGHMTTHTEGVAGYTSAYEIFLDSIPFNFYPILALFFGLLLILTRRDFGPMARAERRAVEEGKLIADDAVPLSSSEMDDSQVVDPQRLYWWNGALPIVVLVGTVIFGLYFDGISSVENPESLEFMERVRQAYGAAASTNVLLWASFFSVITAWVLALSQGLLTLKQASDTTTRGIKAMMLACLVLVLAWALADLCKTLNTSGWLIQQVSFSFSFLPLIVFLLAGVVGFSTGSSWSTMAILVPLTMAYAYDLGLAEGADPETLRTVLLASLGGVLAGAVFGDHCSPISDTTVMSSMASGCDHMDHVRTQMPYALLVGATAAGFGYLPAGFGWPAWVGLAGGAAFLGLCVLVLGRPTPKKIPLP